MSDVVVGSRWWKFDFHTHTPFSIDWQPNIQRSGDDALSPADWLGAYADAGIECVAVTDHNGGGWIDHLVRERQRLAETDPRLAGITIFPGVELSVEHGVHVLAILDPSQTTGDIDRLLGAVGYDGPRGDPERRVNRSVFDVAKIINDFGGLCIPAHVDDVKGWLYRPDADSDWNYDTGTVRQLLESGYLSAIEVKDPNWQSPPVFEPVGNSLPRVIGSDCHGFSRGPQPGDAFTWVKMGTPSVEGLRLALLDGREHSRSIIRSDVHGADNGVGGDPNHKPDNTIRQVTIDGMRLMGRREPVTAGFSPWLTTLIGGRGSGKSTIIDGIRVAMERAGDLPEELRDDFADFVRVAGSRRERGAMLPGSTIVVEFERPTGVYRLTWRMSDGETRIEQRDDDGEFVPAAGDVRHRFPIRVLSQKEIFAKASDTQSLISLVDASPQLRLNDWRQENKELTSRLRSLLSRRRELEATASARSKVLGELDEVKQQIAIFERGENRETLRGFQRAKKQTRLVDARRESMDRLADRLNEVVRDEVPESFDESLFETEDERVGLALLRESVELQATFTARIQRIVEEITEAADAWRQRLETSAWGIGKAQTESAYETLVDQLAEAGIADPTRYTALVQQQQLLNQHIERIEAADRETTRVDTEIDEAIARVFKHRTELSLRRMDFLSDVLSHNNYVRVRILPFGIDVRDCEPSFRQAIHKPDAMESAILSEDGKQGILAGLYEGLPNGDAERQVELVKRVQTIKAECFDMALTGRPSPRCNQWLAKHLKKLPPERLDDLRFWFPEDVLQVDYRRDNTRDSWAPIEQGSPGQKTAAILAFLLSHGDEPILLDQPEDDLDNLLIYDLIVRQIRESKTRRQMIIATHNPNIVVNGDAEMVLSMESRAGQCHVDEESSGCLQDAPVREEVCRVMEGGRDAFTKRYRRIVTPPSRS